MGTIDVNGDFAEEHCLVYANVEVLYTGELYFLLIIIIYYSVFVLSGHINKDVMILSLLATRFKVLCYLLKKWDVSI